MAMEQRGNGRYYYRKVWRNSTCVSEYAGHGPFADLSALSEERERQERAAERASLRRFIQEQRRVDQAIEDYGEQVRQVVAETLQRLGYHQHKRQWRLERSSPGKRKAECVSTDLQQGQPTLEEIVEYRNLFRAAKGKGRDSAEVLRLRVYCLEHPTIYNTLLSTAGEILNNAIESAAASPAVEEHMHGEVDAMKHSLGFASASAVERMLIETVILAWVRLQTMEAIYTKKYSTSDGVSLTYAAYLENRLNATHRRYLRAVESLARVRRLLSRAGVQVNVAAQQVVVNR